MLLHEPPSTYGLIILLPMAAYILGNAGVARLSVALGSARLLIVDLTLSLVSGVMLALWCLVELAPWALRHYFSSAVKTPSQFCGGASIWNCAIRRRYRS